MSVTSASGGRPAGRRSVDKDRWIERVEDEFGAFGTVYYDSDGRVLGSMQYGPAPLFPRAYELPAGPPSDGAILITCAYVVDESSPWVLQSLFLAAIGEARDRGAESVEAFSYRYPEGESGYERFRVHKTVFPCRLPWRLRLPGDPRVGPCRAGPPRSRRPAAGRRGTAREGAARRRGGLPAGAGSGAATLI